MKLTGVKESKYKEMHEIAKLNFGYTEKEDEMEEVSDIASFLHYLPFKYSIAGSSLFEDFDDEKISDLLDKMSPEKSIILLGS